MEGFGHFLSSSPTHLSVFEDLFFSIFLTPISADIKSVYLFNVSKYHFTTLELFFRKSKYLG